MVWNLLTNAVKFTPPHGHIRLRIDREGESAVVRISDSGEGIPRLFLPHVFDMFAQERQALDRTQGGLGLGLAGLLPGATELRVGHGICKMPRLLTKDPSCGS